VLCRLQPDQDYEWLLPRSTTIDIGARRVRVVDLPTLIEVKRAAGREKDRLALPVLLRTLQERSKPR